MSLKRSVHVSHQVLSMLLNFSKEYKTWLIQGGHSLVVILTVQTDRSVRDADIVGL